VFVVDRDVLQGKQENGEKVMFWIKSLLLFAAIALFVVWLGVTIGEVQASASSFSVELDGYRDVMLEAGK
jgi:hypothetical protein